MERLTTRQGREVSECVKCRDMEECYSAIGCGALDRALNKLADYERLEEQGLLLKLPCKVGDAVYFVDRKFDRENKEFVSFVHNGYVKAIKFSSRPTKVTVEYEDLDDWKGRCKGMDISASSIGKRYFLSKAEAEKALAEMKGE